MPQGSTTFHESEERLSPATRDMHRAIVSLMEELEAIDWYQQRLGATEDGDLREILRHNRDEEDEEKEHAAMVLEWIRRHDRVFGTKLREYLFTEGSIGREAVLERRRPAPAMGRSRWPPASAHCEEDGDGPLAPPRRASVRSGRDVLAAVHRSPVLREPGAVFSTRGGDFVITVGGDLATGYRLYDRDAVHLSCVETVAPQAVGPDAVCMLEG